MSWRRRGGRDRLRAWMSERIDALVARTRASRKPSAADMEDPDLLLRQAHERMVALHCRNRDRAVQAILMKNNLDAMVQQVERTVAQKKNQARAARAGGDEARASSLLLEAERYARVLEEGRTNLKKAEEFAKVVKHAISREETVVRHKTAEMLALQTQWKLVQVERSLMISLAQLTAIGNEPITRERVGDRHRYSRELVVEAITHKNVLASMADETRRKAERLRKQAAIARREEDEAHERELLRELEQQEAILAATEGALQRANEVTERARALLSDEANRFRALNLDPAALPSASVPEPRRPARRNRRLRRVALLLAVFGAVLLLFFRRLVA